MRKLEKKLPFQLKCSLSLSVDVLEDWLSVHCDGAYEMNFEDILETDSIFNQLSILFSFEYDADRQNFKKAVQRGEL